MTNNTDIKNVLITGARGGLGKAMIDVFAKHSCNIYAHCRQQDNDFEKYLSEISNKYKVKTNPLYFDMTNYEEMKSCIKELFQQKIRIDVLINNAGVAHGGLFQMTPVSKIRNIFEINLFAQMEITQLILKIMTKNKYGIIINMSSIAGLDLAAGNCAYGVSKAALAAWTKILAAECTKYNIRVNAIAPGLADTNMAGLMEEKAKNDMIISSAMERLASPSEIAEVAYFLASEKASFVNGQVIRVDGGSK